MMYLPYVKKTSELIQRVCSRLAVFKSYGTLRQTLVKVKNPRDELKKKDVVHVYEVPCLDCERTYVGETGRNLQKRLYEHKIAVRKCDTKNGIAVHAWDSHHRINWVGAKVISPIIGRRESWHIQKRGNTTNLDCGLSLNSIWTPFLSL